MLSWTNFSCLVVLDESLFVFLSSILCICPFYIHSEETASSKNCVSCLGMYVLLLILDAEMKIPSVEKHKADKILMFSLLSLELVKI